MGEGRRRSWEEIGGGVGRRWRDVDSCIRFLYKILAYIKLD